MREHPPPELVNLLSKLGLAREEQVRAVRGRVRRLSRDLPAFESVWVDALAQARVLTPYQAAEINAGRGKSLEVGPFVLFQPLPSPGYARVFRAYQRRQQRWMRLSIISCSPGAQAEISARLKSLVHRGAGLATVGHLAPVVETGTAGENKLWAAAPDVRGQTAAEWMIHHGRFPPAAVLEIAQQMLAALLACEQAELLHGDLRPGQVLLDGHGKVWLPEPGLRLAVRPDEGFGHAELPPEAYECLAPERVAAGTTANTASDIYACGCLWWHLLAGRPAIPGATSLAKLRAAQTVKVLDVCQLAPDVPAALAETISECLRRDPKLRPDTMGRLAVRLATPSRTAKSQLARAARRSATSLRRPSPIARVTRRPARKAMRLAAAASAVAAALVGAWPYWGAAWLKHRSTAPSNASPQQASAVGEEPDRLPTDQALASLGKPNAAVAPDDHGAVLQTAWTEPAANVLELKGGKPQRLDGSSLTNGMTVRGPAGKRAAISAPPTGLVVDAEDVHFENVDFIADGSPAPRGDAAAMVMVRALSARFSGCSFQSAAANLSTDRLPAAIAWLGSPPAGESELTLPAGELSVQRCVFRQVSAAVRCEIGAALTFDFAHSLHLGPGPLIVLAEAPQVDEPITLALEHVTLRGAFALLECRYQALGDEAGKLAVLAADCAFVPAPGAGLVVFRGAAHPGPLIEHFNWSGQGSVLAREAPLALWHGANGRIRAAAEEMIQVAGLVRTEVGFAGEAEQGPAASRIVRWQVPLRSPDPPGIGEDALSLPLVGRK